MSAVIVFILRLLLVAALLAFVGWALFTLWQDLRIQSRMIIQQKIPRVSIYVHDTGETKEFGLVEIIIGREGGCDLCLSNDTVSIRHARLKFSQNQWWIEDLQSTNGTYLNDEKVDAPVVLLSGDEVRCAKVSFDVTFK